jgi:hypothetical protein
MEFIYRENMLIYLLFLCYKVPNSLLKSRDFQEECILSAIQVLSAHFAQWSYHVSFPEVATIPLILLKILHEHTALESIRRPVKQLIDKVIYTSDNSFWIYQHPLSNFTLLLCNNLYVLA